MIGMSFPDSQAASVPLASHPGLLAGPSIPFGPEFASFILFLRFSRSLVALLESASERGCWAILNTTEGIKILSCRWRKDEFGGGGGGGHVAGRSGRSCGTVRTPAYPRMLAIFILLQDIFISQRPRSRYVGFGATSPEEKRVSVNEMEVSQQKSSLCIADHLGIMLIGKHLLRKADACHRPRTSSEYMPGVGVRAGAGPGTVATRGWQHGALRPLTLFAYVTGTHAAAASDATMT